MRRLTAGACAAMLLLATEAVARPAGDDQEVLRNALAAKLAEPWVKDGGWITDLDAAKKGAKESGKRILAYFTRSYAPCPPCKAMEEDVFSTREFRELAKEVVPFLSVTGQVEGRREEGLFSSLGGVGYPRVLAMDAEGGLLGELDGASVQTLRDGLKKAETFALLLARKDRTPEEERLVLRNEMMLNRIGGADARKRFDALKDPDPSTRRDLDRLLLHLEIQDELKKIVKPDLNLRVAAGKVFAGFWKDGREPQRTSSDFEMFFCLIVDFAEREKDVALFEKAFGRIQEYYARNPRAEPLVKAFEARLEKLKNAAGPPKKK